MLQDAVKRNIATIGEAMNKALKLNPGLDISFATTILTALTVWRRASTTFGKYEVKADLFTGNSYNEYLQKMLRTVTMRVQRVGGGAQRETLRLGPKSSTFFH